MTTAMYGQPMTSVSPYGAYPFSSSQLQPYQQAQQQMPFGYGMMSQPFAQQSQPYGMPVQQILHAVAQQLNQVNQHIQHQSQLLQQLIQFVPQQLQQIQQFLHALPQAMQQQSQIHQQPFGPGIGAFGALQQPFGGPSPWTGGGMPQQSATSGQTGTGGSVGFPTSGGQSGLVM